MTLVLAETDEMPGGALLSTVQGQLEDTDALIERLQIQRVSNQQYVWRIWYVGEDDYYGGEANTLPG